MTCLWQPKRRVSHRLTLARRVKTLKGCYTLSTTTDQQQVWLNPFLRMIIKQVRSKPAKRIPVCYVCGGKKGHIKSVSKKSSKTDQKMLCTTIKCGCKTTNLWYDEEEEDDDRYHRSLPLTWFFLSEGKSLFNSHIFQKCPCMSNRTLVDGMKDTNGTITQWSLESLTPRKENTSLTITEWWLSYLSYTCHFVFVWFLS